jgi:hypothetical protein
MKALIRCVVIVVVICAVLAYFNWPAVQFRLALLRLSVSDGGVPAFGETDKNGFSVSTFTHDVSSATIGNLYEVACDRLETLRKGFPRRTYHWVDGERWDRVTSVVQFPSCYLSVTAGNNNDNDSVSVRIDPGVFPPSNPGPDRFLELKELPDDRLPPRTLRFQRRGER